MANSLDPLAFLSPSECNQIITKYLNSSDYDLKDYRVECVNDVNVIGYIGEYYWLLIDIKVDQQIENMRFFIKSLPRNNEDKKAHVKSYFEKEYRVYTEIFEEYNAYGDCQWKPCCYLLREDCLVMENLQDRGYSHVSIYGNGLDQLHMECVLKSLAEMHADSVGLEQNGVNLEAKYGKLFTEVNVTPDNIWFAYQIEAIKHVIFNTPELQHYIKHLEMSLFEDVPQQTFAMFRQSTKYRNVFSHGDPWISNLMFTYSVNCSDREIPQHAILIDYQLCRYLPPAIDVLLSIFFNTRRENREKHLEYYLEFYWHNLQSELASRKLNIDEELPWNEFKESCQYYKYLVVLFNCRYIFSKMKPGTLQAIERDDPERYSKICSTERGKFTIEIMEKDAVHREIALEIFQEFLEVILMSNAKSIKIETITL